MRGAILENSCFAGSSETAYEAWLSVDEIISLVRLQGYKVSARQLERWREHKLLSPGVHQIGHPGHGGTYRFPPETVLRAIAIVQLLKEKDDLTWVGRELWRRGYEVDESLWRPLLVETATKLDSDLAGIKRIVRRERHSDNFTRCATLADRAAKEFPKRHWKARTLTSRILGRVRLAQIPSLLNITLEAASGIIPEYETQEIPENELIFIRATDLSYLRLEAGPRKQIYHDDTLLGNSLGLVGALKFILGDIARAFKYGSLCDAAAAPRQEIEQARDDLRCILQTAQALYQSTKWIYGRRAFGLGFADWMARKSPPNINRAMLLLWVLMRRSGADVLSSEEIRRLHIDTMSLADKFKRLEIVSKQDGPLGKFLRPSHLKRVFSGQLPFAEFERRIRFLAEGQSLGIPNANAGKR